MSVACECCVLSDRSLCDGLITRPEESYRVWCDRKYNTSQYNTSKYNKSQYNTSQYNTSQYNMSQYNTSQYTSNTSQYNFKTDYRMNEWLPDIQIASAWRRVMFRSLFLPRLWFCHISSTYLVNGKININWSLQTSPPLFFSDFYQI